MRIRSPGPRSLALCSTLLACGDAQPGATTGTGSSEVSTTEVATGEATVGPVTTDDSVGGDTSGDGVVFIAQPDGLFACDPWQQNCPEGEKCALWASDGGGWWNDARCVPVTGDARFGEPCTVQDSAFSGLDDCEEGALCWRVDAELHGVCVTLCNEWDGSGCADEDLACTVSSDIFNFCVPACDLLLQDCPGAELCIPAGDQVMCVFDASGAAGAAFDPCEFINACDPGLVCAASMSAVECDPNVSGCCVPMCDLGAMNTCPGVGQSCVSLHEEGQAPPKYAEVGYCTVPF